MKILFVCRGNIARSQMAEAICNRLAGKHVADSAGTQADPSGETLAARSKRIGSSMALETMQKYGYDQSNSRQTLLTKDMLDRYDLVISMAAKRYTPVWLASAPNYVYWKIADPRGRSYKITETTFRKVETKVRELLAKNEQKL